MEPLRVATTESSTAVCCLDCARVYAKPVGGGTITTNPGCPYCGYVGWVAAAETLSEAPLRGRSAADRLRLLSGRRR